MKTAIVGCRFISVRQGAQPEHSKIIQMNNIRAWNVHLNIHRFISRNGDSPGMEDVVVLGSRG